MIASFTVKSGDFSLRKQLLVFLGMSFMVIDITQFSNEAKETWKWVNTAKILIERIMVPSKKRKCAVPPDLFHSEISFSSPCNIPNHCLSKKTKRYLKLMRIYFVFSEDLVLILTIQKVCNWFRILLTKILMLTKTNICSDWNHLMGNNGANWIPATGGRSSKRNILWLHTWELTFAQRRRCPNFHTLCKIAMRILTMFGSTYSSAASLTFQIWTS